MFYGANISADDGYALMEEPPETPAHIFAVRAFKTALFGTPAPDQQGATPRPKLKRTGRAGPLRVESQVEENDDGVVDDHEGKRILSPRKLVPLASPTKGILVTPGTATTKRKSVSFGNLTTNAQGNSMLPPQASDGLPTDLSNSLGRSELFKQDLRRTLFESRMQKAERAQSMAMESIPGQNVETRQPISTESLEDFSTAEQRAEKQEEPTLDEDREINPDITIDLKSPRSRSGKHWKREYQRDHDKSKLEMRKLIQYSKIAKSYAEKKDKDAVHLAEKLKTAEKRMKEMEQKVSELASELVDVRTQDENQADLLNQLASQTAQVLRYKQKAERYRLALSESRPTKSSKVDRQSHPLDQSNSAELSTLRAAAKNAEDRVSELEQENLSLKRTVLRVKEEMKKFEIRQAARRERKKQSEEKAAAQRRLLKEELEAARLQNRILTERLESVGKENKQSPQSTNHRESLHELDELRGLLGEARIVGDESKTGDSRSGFEGQDATQSSIHQPKPPGLDRGPRGSRKPRNERVLEARQKKDQLPTPHEGVKSFERRARAESSGLSSEDVWTATMKLPEHRASHLDLSFGRTLSPIHQNAAQMPSTTLDHQASSPLSDRSGPQIDQRRSSDALSSSRTSSIARRTPLPPDRAAAAKRRLEQRRVERKMSTEAGKENDILLMR